MVLARRRPQARVRDGASPVVASAAMWCCEYEITAGDIDAVVPRAPQQAHARVLVRLRGDPLGYLTLPLTTSGIDADALRAAVDEHWRKRIDATGRRGAPPVSDASFCTVVVCTRNRADSLPACLSRLRALRYEHLEFVIVDNAPADGATRAVVTALQADDHRFRYVLEPRPGLSFARNRGLAVARGEFIAYTDDDVAVDPGWLHGLARGFARRDDVGCVTGLVCTASISTPAEAYFDARAASWSSRFEAELFDLRGRVQRDVLYPYSAGMFGTGASFAFRTDLLRELGGFDEALGAGTRTRGGEDLDIFVRVLRAGRAIAYEPSSVVWHHHRADEKALARQMYGYGTGLSAYLTKLLLQRSTRPDVLRRVPLGLRKMARIGAETGARMSPDIAAPAGAQWSELRGFLTGPVLYLRARRECRTASGGEL